MSDAASIAKALSAADGDFQEIHIRKSENVDVSADIEYDLPEVHDYIVFIKRGEGDE